MRVCGRGVRRRTGTLGAGLGGVVVVFGESQFAQCGVVVGFEVVGDESVGGVDSAGIVAGARSAARRARWTWVARMRSAGSACAVISLGDGERHSHCQGGEAVQDQVGDGGCPRLRRQMVSADRGAGGDSLALAGASRAPGCRCSVCGSARSSARRTCCIPPSPAAGRGLPGRVPAFRSSPCAAALAARVAWLASNWVRVMYPGWASGSRTVHSGRGLVMVRTVPLGAARWRLRP